MDPLPFHQNFFLDPPPFPLFFPSHKKVCARCRHLLENHSFSHPLLLHHHVQKTFCCDLIANLCGFSLRCIKGITKRSQTMPS